MFPFRINRKVLNFNKFIAKTIEENNQAIENSSNEMTKEQLKQAKEMTNSFVSPFSFATLNLITTLLKSFVISLVIGIIKKS